MSLDGGLEGEVSHQQFQFRVGNLCCVNVQYGIPSLTYTTILFCCIWLADATHSENRDFEMENLRLPPERFSFTPACNDARHEWQVEQDGNNQVLVRRLTKSNDRHVSLAIADKPELLDVFLSVRIKSDAGLGPSGSQILVGRKIPRELQQLNVLAVTSIQVGIVVLAAMLVADGI